ncbi:MAG: hypothetical protein CSB06_01080 [Bacteroidia bacterium]|nr:MAG: hypothetical protein CSB06_01080 [Bacteroidia bacterium]
MKFRKDIKISTGFILLYIAVFAFVLGVGMFTYFSFKKVRSNAEYLEKINSLQQHCSAMRESKYAFLLSYNTDNVFFENCENQFVTQFTDNAAWIVLETKNIKEIIPLESIAAKKYLHAVIEANKRSKRLFVNLLNDICKMGNRKTGLAGELEQNIHEIKTSASTFDKQALNALKQAENYLLRPSEKNYRSFLFSVKKNKRNLPQARPEIESDSILVPEQDSIAGEDFIESSASNIWLKFTENMETYHRMRSHIGFAGEEGLLFELNMQMEKLKDAVFKLNATATEGHKQLQKRAMRNIILFTMLLGILLFLLLLYQYSAVIPPMHKLRDFVKPLASGKIPLEKNETPGAHELLRITNDLHQWAGNLHAINTFAEAIGKGNYNAEYQPQSTHDELGNTLLEMQKNILSTRKEEEKRKENERVRSWQDSGLTKFDNVLRQNQGDIEKTGSLFISELVKFLDANQAGMFILNDDTETPFFEMIAAYAYGHEKKRQKTFRYGEGLAGTAAVEKKTIYMTDIPETYASITSGLGGARPTSLLIVPMISEDEVVGVIEIASFKEFAEHEIEFMKTLSGNIASFVVNIKTNRRTEKLLEQSRKQAEMMQTQEEEMRQNYKELQLMQEESSRRSAEMSDILFAINEISLIFEIDTQGKIRSANESLLKLWEASKEDIVGVPYSSLLKDLDSKEYEEFWKELTLGKNIQKEEFIRFRDKVYHFSILFASISDDTGNMSYVLSFATILN